MNPIDAVLIYGSIIIICMFLALAFWGLNRLAGSVKFIMDHLLSEKEREIKNKIKAQS